MSKHIVDPNLFLEPHPSLESFWYCYGTLVSTQVMNLVYLTQFISSGFSSRWLLNQVESVGFPYKNNALSMALSERQVQEEADELQRIENEQYRRANYPTATERAEDEAIIVKDKARKESYIANGKNRLKGMHKGISGSNAIPANWEITP